MTEAEDGPTTTAGPAAADRTVRIECGTAGSGVDAGRAGRLAAQARLVLLCLLGVVVVADAVSRFATDVTWIARLAIVLCVASAAVAAATGVALVVAARGTQEVAAAVGVAFVLIVASVVLRLGFWEPGIGTPIRAALPALVALGIVLLADRLRRGRADRPVTQPAA